MLKHWYGFNWCMALALMISVLMFFMNSGMINNVYAKSDRVMILRSQHSYNSYKRGKKYDGEVVRNKNYGFDDNYKSDVNTSHPRSYYHTVAGNDGVNFSHPMYLHYAQHVKYNYGHKHGDPQSMMILPNGNLYVLFNAGHGDSRLDRIFKYDVKNGRLLKVGRIFKGGHGQGLSYDYQTHVIWMCMNKYRHNGYPHGILPKDLILSRVNKNSLVPSGRRHYISSHHALGENFAYDKWGDYWNVARSYSSHSYAPRGSLKIYEGHNGRLRLVRDLLHSSSACIQNLCYNPETNRLYVIGNGCILSFPVSYVHNLYNGKIRVAIMNHHSEFEGMGFWKRRAYLLVSPNMILRSNKEF